MRLNAYNCDIDKFVEKFYCSDIQTELIQYVRGNTTQFSLSKDTCENAELEKGTFKFNYASNVDIQGDILQFDAVVSGKIQITYAGSRPSATKNKRFRARCQVVAGESGRDFTILWVALYAKSKKKNPLKTPTNNLIPTVSKEDFDDEATKFLAEYCPEALEIPMPIPIEDIIQVKLKLDLIQNKRLTRDFNVLGQICFSPGEVEVYDVHNDIPHKIPIKRGTILVDACTPYLRNLGCVKNGSSPISVGNNRVKKQ